MSGFFTALAGIASGILGGMGMGGGGILILVLTLLSGYEQTLAQGINLIFFIPCAIIAIIIYSRQGLIKWKLAIPFSILGIIGALLGSYISGIIDGKLLSKLFGILLLIIGIRQLFNKQH